MSKKSIATRLSVATGYPVTECNSIVEHLFDAIIEETNTNKRLVIRGFGSFLFKESKERNGRNPKTGEKLIINSRIKVKFVANRGFIK